MAHLVDSLAWSGQVPWHGLGTKLPENVTGEDMVRFAGLDWEPGHSGVPLLADAIASFEFDTVAEHSTGDHWIVVGRVDNLRISASDDPLIFFAGAFHALQ